MIKCLIRFILAKILLNMPEKFLQALEFMPCKGIHHTKRFTGGSTKEQNHETESQDSDALGSNFYSLWH